MDIQEMKGFHERRRNYLYCLCTVLTNHGSSPSVCLFPCWSVAINLLTNLARPLKTFHRVWCARKPPGSHASLLHTHPSPRSLPLNCYSFFERPFYDSHSVKSAGFLVDHAIPRDSPTNGSSLECRRKTSRILSWPKGHHRK